LVAFQRRQDQLETEGISIVAASTDSRDNAAKMAEETGVTYPVGFGLPVHETASLLGAYHEERRGILHATGLLARPDGAVGAACYSTGPIGRFVPDDVIGLVAFWKKMAKG
jgi:peroxiredoxin